MLYSGFPGLHWRPCSCPAFRGSFVCLPIGIDSASGLQSCDNSAGMTMLERRDDLLERLACSDSFARMPVNFAESPVDRMDAFSEILSGIKLNGAVFFNAEFSAPWGISVPVSKQIADRLAPGMAHSLLYHLVVDGNAVVETADGNTLELNSGDVVI